MKRKWLIIFFIIGILTLGLIVILNYSAPKYSDADFKITTYKSLNDEDNDGLDDQSDFLRGVKEYLATKPKYKSQYYAGGYPTDEYGVCTDVVAFGLLKAGYNLRNLVDLDIKNNPQDYAITNPDKNIDFRRVRNLLQYFSHQHLSLTTDIKEISSWQAGDIVVFENHIGVISEHRNKKGQPFVYHHERRGQKNYEEDILNKYPIVGHFRIS